MDDSRESKLRQVALASLVLLGLAGVGVIWAVGESRILSPGIGMLAFAGLVIIAIGWTLFQHAWKNPSPALRSLASLPPPDDEKTLFLANVTHELRTPLNGILGMTNLALETKLTGEQRDCLAAVKTSAEALLAIINDILDFSKIQSGKLRIEQAEFSLRDALYDALNLLSIRAHHKRLELAYRVHPDLPDRLIGDSHRLRQILTNLVGNAIKFTTAGEVVVHVDAAARTDRKLMLAIRVQDTGIGISPEQMQQIFRPFEQADASVSRKYGGTGLGLAISRHLIELLGGDLKVESEVGKGSMFQFTAPMDVAAEQPSVKRKIRHVVGAKILVVESNATQQRVLDEWLTSWKALPTVVAQPDQGLVTLQAACSAGAPFALLILDAAGNPERALEMVREVRQSSEFGQIPVILTTSASNPPDRRACQDLAVVGLVRKPIKQSTLLELVSESIEGDGPLMTQMMDQESLLEAVAAEMAPKSFTSSVHPLKILVAEDNAINRKFAERMLKKQGHDVTLVTNGQEAIDRWTGDRFDVVLMDVQMDGKDGIAATIEIRQLEQAQSAARTPIIAMTAHALPEYREKCRTAGMDGFVTKPIQAPELDAELKRVLK